MPVIEAQCASILVPHDHRHINQKSVSRHTAACADAINEPGAIAPWADLLAEDLIHDFSPASQSGDNLVPVDQLSRGCLVVPASNAIASTGTP